MRRESFLTDLIISPLKTVDSSLFFRIVEPFIYKLDRGVIVVPYDFVTDFASVPRMFWSVIPPWGQHGKAAVIHDYLYESHDVDRFKADRIFLEAMIVLGVSYAKRTIMYRAVRMFGAGAYKKAPAKRSIRRDKLLR